MKVSLNTLCIEKTSSRGAEIYITLTHSNPAEVQRSAYLLFNHGFVPKLPDTYKDGIDETVTLLTNRYTLGKVARGLAIGITAAHAGQYRSQHLAVATRSQRIFRTLLRIVNYYRSESLASDSNIGFYNLAAN